MLSEGADEEDVVDGSDSNVITGDSASGTREDAKDILAGKIPKLNFLSKS